MKLKEIILENNVAQRVGNISNTAGKAAGAAIGAGTEFGSNLIQGIKKGFGASPKDLLKKTSDTKKSVLDSVNPRKLKDIIDKILTGQQLDPMQIELLKDLKRKL